MGTDTAPRARFPEEDMGRDCLPERKAAQIDAARHFTVFHSFQFSDLKESGITFGGYRACSSRRTNLY